MNLFTNYHIYYIHMKCEWETVVPSSSSSSKWWMAASAENSEILIEYREIYCYVGAHVCACLWCYYVIVYIALVRALMKQNVSKQYSKCVQKYLDDFYYMNSYTRVCISICSIWASKIGRCLYSQLVHTVSLTTLCMLIVLFILARINGHIDIC